MTHETLSELLINRMRELLTEANREDIGKVATLADIFKNLHMLNVLEKQHNKK